MKAPALALALVCALPLAAVAQTPSTAPDVSAAAAQNSGPMIIQQVHSTFVIAPDAKFTRYDDKNVWLAGAYGGVLVDEQWLIGAGGYGMTNGGHDRGLWYFGGVFGWMPGGDRPITVSARVLLGFGEAEYSSTYTDYVTVGGPMPFNPTNRNQPPPTLRPVNYSVRYNEDVFVAEPQVDVAFRIAPWGRITAGAGYRAVDSYHYHDYYGYDYYGDHPDNGHRLHGATASVSLQLGRF